MKQWYLTLKTNWAAAFTEKYFWQKFIVNTLVCVWLYSKIKDLLVANRFRAGTVLGDPIQKLFIPHNFSVLIFTLTYSCIALFLLYIVARPTHFYFALRAFLAVFLFRFSFIYLVPLSPPPDMIFLNDPILSWFVGYNQDITNDLFFSGHVADICIFIFCCRSNWLRYFMTACAVTVGLLLVWQHVHYTADVIGAPFFAYASYMLFAKKQIDSQGELR